MNWERVRLGEVCKIYQPKTITQKEITKSGKYKVFGANGVIGYYDKYNHDFEEVAVTCRGATCGTVNMTEAQSWITGNAMVITPLNSDISKKYLFHYLKNYNMERVITGSAQPQITKINIENILFIIPPMSVQKEIVEKLDKATAIREKSKALLAHYDALAESLFIELFGDPISNEKGWEKKKLGEVVTNLNNMRVPLKSSDRQMLVNKYPYYGASGIIDYVDDFIYEGDNLLIGEDGANLLSRSTPIAFIAKGKYWVNNHAHVNGYNGKANLLYLCFFINMIDLSPYVTGSAQPKLNRGNLDNIEIPLPPLSLQVKFAEMVENIEEQKARAKAEIEQSEAVFQALLQESFG